MSTSKTFIKRDFYKFFKNDLKQLREVKPPGKAVVPQFYNSDKIFPRNVIVEVFYVVFTFTLVHVSSP